MSISHYFFYPTIIVFVTLSVAVVGNFTQGSFAALSMGVCLCVFAVRASKSTKITFPSSAALIAGGLLLIISLISTRADFSRYGLFGAAAEWGTLVSVFMFVTTFFAGSLSSKQMVSVFLWAAELCGAFGAALIVLIAAGVLPLSLIAASWMQLSIIFCGAALIAGLRSDHEAATPARATHAALAALSFFAFLALFIPEIAAAAIGSALVVAYSVSRARAQRFPSASVVIALALLAVLVYGQRVPLLSLAADGRPTLHSSALVVGAAYLASSETSLIGTGPHSFPYTWDLYRPAEVNDSSYWMFTPKYPYSTFTVVSIEMGLLGMFAFMFFFAIPIRSLFVASARDGAAYDERGALAVFAFFCMMSTLVISLGTPLLIIAAYAVGLCARSTTTIGSLSRKHWIYLVAAAIGILGILLVWTSLHQIQAQHADAHGLALLNANDAVGAAPFFEQAADYWEVSEYDQDAAEAYKQIAFTQQKSSSAETAQAALAHASQFAQRVGNMGTNDFTRWLYLGSFYLNLLQHGVAGSAEPAEAALAKAAALSPTRPEVPYTRALISVAQHDIPSARREIGAALALKPDYGDALRLLLKITPVP